MRRHREWTMPGGEGLEDKATLTSSHVRKILIYAWNGDGDERYQAGLRARWARQEVGWSKHSDGLGKLGYVFTEWP